jgi:hypothetical protein
MKRLFAAALLAAVILCLLYSLGLLHLPGTEGHSSFKIVEFHTEGEVDGSVMSRLKRGRH